VGQAQPNAFTDAVCCSQYWQLEKEEPIPRLSLRAAHVVTGNRLGSPGSSLVGVMT
jgi:hypothetical protein